MWLGAFQATVASRRGLLLGVSNVVALPEWELHVDASRQRSSGAQHVAQRHPGLAVEPDQLH